MKRRGRRSETKTRTRFCCTINKQRSHIMKQYLSEARALAFVEFLRRHDARTMHRLIKLHSCSTQPWVVTNGSRNLFIIVTTVYVTLGEICTLLVCSHHLDVRLMIHRILRTNNVTNTLVFSDLPHDISSRTPTIIPAYDTTPWYFYSYKTREMIPVLFVHIRVVTEFSHILQ